MKFLDTIQGLIRTAVLLSLGFNSGGGTEQNPAAMMSPFPSPETLSYRIEWRMVTAGAAKLQLLRAQQNWQILLNVESAGLVSRLYRIEDNYKVTSNDNFCGVNSSFEAKEGKRHVTESEQFDNSRHKGIFDVHDLVKNQQEHHEVDIAQCTHEIIGALASLRLTSLEPGKSVTLSASL